MTIYFAFLEFFLPENKIFLLWSTINVMLTVFVKLTMIWCYTLCEIIKIEAYSKLSLIFRKLGKYLLFFQFILGHPDTLDMSISFAVSM